MSNTTAPSKADPKLKDKLFKDMEGIFAWAVVGLCRLRARGRFQPSPQTRAFLERYKKDANPIAAFVDECCEVGSGGFEPSEDMWAAYKAWCAKTGRTNVWPLNRFIMRLASLETTFYKQRSTRSGKQRMCIHGLALMEGLDLD